MEKWICYAKFHNLVVVVLEFELELYINYEMSKLCSLFSLLLPAGTCHPAGSVQYVVLPPVVSPAGFFSHAFQSFTFLTVLI